MDYEKEKVDEYTLALLYLVTHEREGGFGARAWKGFDWETMNRLHEKRSYYESCKQSEICGHDRARL